MLILDGVAGLLVLILAPLVFIAARRQWLRYGAGAVDLSLRLFTGPLGRGWATGVGRFEGDELRWYRMFSVWPRPSRVVSRRDLRVGSTRQPTGGEALSLHRGALVVECHCDGGSVELAMDRSALTGFLAWLEAQPPGATLPS